MSMTISEKILFEATLNAFNDLMALDQKTGDDWSPEYAEAFGRFSSLYDLVEGLGLEDAYQTWKKEKNGETENENETEIEKE